MPSLQQTRNSELICLINGAVQGKNAKNTWGAVGSKIEALLTTNIVDPLEAFGERFASNFVKAALAEAGTVAATVLPKGLGQSFVYRQLDRNAGARDPVILTTLEQ